MGTTLCTGTEVLPPVGETVKGVKSGERSGTSQEDVPLTVGEWEHEA